MESELSKFKHVLEYFVAHQNYKQSGDSESTLGYQQYIKPFIDDGTFQHTGSGWKEASIQRQISKWDNICSHRICISIKPNYGSYTSRKSYLNWQDTGINILCEWKNNKVVALQIGYAFSWFHPTEYKIKFSQTIAELNLFEDNGNNSKLEEFLNLFVHEIYDYEHKRGE